MKAVCESVKTGKVYVKIPEGFVLVEDYVAWTGPVEKMSDREVRVIGYFNDGQIVNYAWEE